MTREELEAVTKVVANMVFGYNGSDKTNPPMVGLEYAIETLKEALESHTKEAVRRERERIRGIAQKELDSTINQRVVEFPPEYGVFLPNRSISMREQLFMCQEVSWRKITDSLTSPKGEVNSLEEE